MRSSRYPALVLTAGLAAALLPAPAHAGPVTVETDRTDNAVTITYDAGSGEIDRHTTERREDGDGVSFQVGIRESDDAGSGLVGRLKLRLDGDRHTVYEGWFSLEITDEDGEIVFRRLRPATIHLRPRPGQRRAALPFRFDVPSGTYEAEGSFES